MTHRKSESAKDTGNGKTNGQAGAHDHKRANGGRGPNGHAQQPATQEGTSMLGNRAASDDAGGRTVAGTAASAAACANREAYAEMAQAEGEGTQLRPPGAASRPASASGKAASDSDRAAEIPPGAEPLPFDGPSFVEAVHTRVDLIALEERLLRSADEKIVQRELAYLRELLYGKGAAFQADDEIPRIVFDAPPDLPSAGGSE